MVKKDRDEELAEQADNQMVESLVNMGTMVRQMYQKKFDLGKILNVVPAHSMVCKCGKMMGLVVFENGILMTCITNDAHGEIFPRDVLDKYVEKTQKIRPKKGLKVRELTAKEVEQEKRIRARADQGYA